MYKDLEKLIETINILRSPGGCDWDREQTHASLKRNMLEEAYEAVDAIDNNDPKHLKEELGDVLLQVVLHAQIAKEDGVFDINDVAKGINEKLIRRHPHVFSDVKVSSTDEIIENWEAIKKQEKTHRTSRMDGVSKGQSALMSALKISQKAIKAGFEWQNEKQLYDCIFSEFDEFKNAKTLEDKEDELGDILFATVNLARWNGIDPEQALLRANKKFMQRFRTMESLATKELEAYSFEEFEELWNKAKSELATNCKGN